MRSFETRIFIEIATTIPNWCIVYNFSKGKERYTCSYTSSAQVTFPRNLVLRLYLNKELTKE